MAIGLLASSAPAANVVQLLYTAPTGSTTSVSGRFTAANTDPTTAAQIWIWRAPNATATPTDQPHMYLPGVELYREYHQEKIVLSPGEKLWVRSSTGKVNFFFEGYEE